MIPVLRVGTDIDLSSCTQKAQPLITFEVDRRVPVSYQIIWMPVI
jgi:hypothetical protein